MKFTTEQAVEALRAELTNKGRKTQHVFDRTITTLVETLTKNKRFVDDEMGLPDFVADAIEILNAYEGDARKKNSDFAKYKELHPESNPNPPADSEPPKPAESPKIAELMERIAALEKDKADANKRASIAQKRKDITAKLKEKGVKDDEWLNDLLSEVNITEDFDVDAKTESYVKLYNKSKANGGGSVPPANPNGGGGNPANAMDDVLALAKQRNEMLNMKI